MLFALLKYLQPTHYFQLLTNKGLSVFPAIEALPNSIVSQLDTDERFQSPMAKAYDLSWQAIRNGYIGNVTTYTSFEAVCLHDNYLFLRKYFHPLWVLYVLFIRLFTLHPPIKELNAWWNTKSIRRVSNNITPLSYPNWNADDTPLLQAHPKVSVIIPTLNRYQYLKDVLSDLEQQDYKNFEVVIVDQSDTFQEAFYKDFNLDIHLIRQEEKALWLARNSAIKQATGELIALSEDDVRIQPDWILSHLKCLDYFDAQVSAGVFYPLGQSIPQERSFFAIATQFATGNTMLHKEVFRKVGLFDRQFEKQRMGDGEFGMRVYLAGLKSISNPYASCVDVKAGTGGLREMGSWDAFRPSNFFAPRPIPSVLYYYRKYYGNSAARLALLKTVPLSIVPYRFKKSKPLLIVGVFISLLLLPLVCYQVYRSWNLASGKLKEGAKIDLVN